MSEVNADLIRLIVAQIEDTPQHWSQKDWVRHNCNTTLCFAGWAVFMEDLIDGSGKPTTKGRAYIRKLNKKANPLFPYPAPHVMYVDENGNDKWYFPFAEVAQELLGLNGSQASRLFAASAACPRNSNIESIDFFKREITKLTGVTFP
jgi:hypothetical protein